jgi:hypothetical protein
MTDMQVSVAEQDEIIEHGTLHLVLGTYPELFTEEELIRALARQPEDFKERDAIQRAIRELTSVGLLQCRNSLVMPSRAARRFEALA